MGNAIEAVRKGMKISEAALRFSVPRITLFNKISGKSPIECAMGPKTILSQSEESIIVKLLIAMGERHFPINRDLLKESVQKIVIEQGKPNPFTNNRPGKKWFQSFLKRHPEISEKTAQSLTKSRDDVSEENIRKWFFEIESYLEEKELKDVLIEPSRIFNTDESAFFLSPKAGKVLCKQGEKHLYNFCGDEKDNLTVLLTANAAGTLAPPMVVFKYDRVPGHISSSVPGDWGIGKSESGWMCGSTFYEYMTNIFNPWLEQQGIKKPILFFLDGHKSHLTLQLSNFCSGNGIEVIALYPNSTHILQPMDLAVFRPLKVAWREQVAKWQLDHLGQTMKKKNFSPVLKNALFSISEDCIRNGFRAGGLCPFRPQYIDMTKIKNRCLTQKEIDPRQVELVKYLESQIIQIYSREKLDLFNDLYYKHRNTLEQILPTEDQSLYIIWAKNKHTSTSSATIEAVEAIPNTITYTNAEHNIPEEVMPSTSRADEITYLDTEEAVNKNETSTDIEKGLEELITNTDLSTYIEHGPEELVDDSDLNANLEHVLENIVTQTSAACSHHETNIDNEELHSVALTVQQTENNEKQTANADHVPVISQSNFMNVSAACSDSQAATPQKQSLEAALGIVISSPFKNNLFWPEDVKETKKRKREKIPFAVTSKSWQEYHKKKQIERQKQQEEKEKRARLRQEKKLQKEKNNEQKKKVGPRSRKKLTGEEDTTPEDTDVEINYAESDDSIYNENDDVRVEECVDSPKSVKCKRRSPCDISQVDHRLSHSCLIRQGKIQSKRRRKNISNKETDSEDKPLMCSRSKSKVKPGQFVIVKYEGEFFPGKTEAVDENQYEISTMVLSASNCFKWPDKPDKIWYNVNDIVELISEPVLLNKRGFYKVKEMEKYLPDLYNV